MKKVLLIAALAVSSVSFAQINFGAQIGGNLANVTISPSEGSTKTNFGISLGAFAEMPVSGQIVFRPEFNFVQKGYKSETSYSAPGVTASESTKAVASYIDIPLNFVYNINAGAGKVFVGAGPSIGFGLGGKITTTGTVNGQTFSGSESIKFDGKKVGDFTGDDTHLKALDFGFGFLAGYKMSNNLSFSLGYNMGLSDINPNEPGSLKNKGIAIKIGYMFGGGKK